MDYDSLRNRYMWETAYVITDSKYCKRCMTERPVTEFGFNRSKEDGLQDNCKPCNTEMRRWAAKRHAKDPHRFKLYEAERAVRYDVRATPTGPLLRWADVQFTGATINDRLDNIRTYVAVVTNSQWWSDWFGSDTCGPCPIQCSPSKARTATTFYRPDPGIRMPNPDKGGSWAYTGNTILHELVHVGLYRAGMKERHGPLFARMLVEILREWLGADIAHQLETALAQRRVPVMDRDTAWLNLHATVDAAAAKVHTPHDNDGTTAEGGD